MILSKFRLLLLTQPSFKKVLKFGKTAFSPRYLLYTNVIISGQLAAAGDVIQQHYQHSKPGRQESWDPKRTSTMLGAGVILTPICHFWYLHLDKLIPGNSVKIAALKLLPDLLLFSPLYVMFFLAVTGLLEGQTWDAFQKEVQHKSISLLSVEICLWTPAQFLNFYLLPTRFRVVYDNFVSLIADVLYSYFRYDFEVEEEDVDGDELRTSEKSIQREKDSLIYKKDSLIYKHDQHS